METHATLRPPYLRTQPPGRVTQARLPNFNPFFPVPSLHLNFHRIYLHHYPPSNHINKHRNTHCSILIIIIKVSNRVLKQFRLTQPTPGTLLSVPVLPFPALSLPHSSTPFTSSPTSSTSSSTCAFPRLLSLLLTPFA
ncbi:unnamed protein product [Closterium sp. NIES-54]